MLLFSDIVREHNSSLYGDGKPHTNSAEEDTSDIILITCEVHSLTPESVQHDLCYGRECGAVMTSVLRKCHEKARKHLCFRFFWSAETDGKKCGRSLTGESIKCPF